MLILVCPCNSTGIQTVLNSVLHLVKTLHCKSLADFHLLHPHSTRDEERRILFNAKDTVWDIENSACLSGKGRVKNPIYIQGKKEGADMF